MPAWRYDLRPGDHLIYRYSFHRQSQSSNNKDRDEERFQTEARFRTHVLVTAENSGAIALGFQSNRESAELTEYVSKGKDQLAPLHFAALFAAKELKLCPKSLRLFAPNR